MQEKERTAYKNDAQDEDEEVEAGKKERLLGTRNRNERCCRKKQVRSRCKTRRSRRKGKGKGKGRGEFSGAGAPAFLSAIVENYLDARENCLAAYEIPSRGA